MTITIERGAAPTSRRELQVEPVHPLVQAVVAFRRDVDELADDSERAIQRAKSKGAELRAAAAQAVNDHDSDRLAEVKQRYQITMQALFAERTTIRLRAAELAARSAEFATQFPPGDQRDRLVDQSRTLQELSRTWGEMDGEE